MQEMRFSDLDMSISMSRWHKGRYETHLDVSRKRASAHAPDPYPATSEVSRSRRQHSRVSKVILCVPQHEFPPAALPPSITASNNYTPLPWYILSFGVNT